jgi:hypothetical protein
MPRHSLVLAAAFAMIAVLASARPALAAYGAFAYDEGAHKLGYSYNEQSQKAADAAALKGCASGDCKIVFRTGPRQCGAIATGDEGKVWGGARRDKKDAAELAAMQDCQKRFSGQCKVKASECNR